MKSLITDNNFLQNLFVEYDCGNFEIDNLYNFLSKELYGFNLIIDIASVEDYEKESLENPILELLLDRILEIRFIANLNENIEKDVFYENLSEFNLFFLSKSIEECEKLIETRGYLYLCNDNIKEKWSIFDKCKEGVKLKVTKSQIIPTELKFDCWTKLEEFNFPSTAYVIFDRYILADKANQKMEKNLLPLLEQLFVKNQFKGKRYLTIIAEELPNNIKLEIRHLYISKWFFEKGINVDLNIIRYNKVFWKKEGLHSRRIFSNYLHIKSDDSFNYFKNNGLINNDTDIQMCFSLNKNNNYFFRKELNDMKDYVLGIENQSRINDVNYNDLYFPNKINPLFN